MIILLLIFGLSSCNVEDYKLVTIIYEEHLPSRIDTLTVQANCINIRVSSFNGVNHIIGKHANYTNIGTEYSGISIVRSTQALKIIEIRTKTK